MRGYGRRLVGLVLIAGMLAGCGGGGGDPAVMSASDEAPTATPTADAGPVGDVDDGACGRSTLTLDVASLGEMVGAEGNTGEFTLTVTGAEEVSGAVTGEYAEPQVARGTWFAVTYTVANDATRDIQPAAQINTRMMVGDAGGRAWANRDWTGEVAGVSSMWATSHGLEDTATMAAPGFEIATAALYDVPADAEPDRVLLALADDSVVCLSLP